MLISFTEERMQMEDFEYTALAARIVFGHHAANGARFEAELDRLDASRVIVVATRHERALVDRLVAPLGDRVVVTFDEVRPHVPVAVAERALQAARAARADGILSIGGGSTTGTAKAIARKLRIPILAVPTTYAGSEVTPVWGLTGPGGKQTGVDAAVLPRVVIYDPQLTLTLSTALSISSGLNALAHAAEALWSAQLNPIVALMSEEAIRALGRALPQIHVDDADLDARASLLYGAWLSGTAFAATGSGLHHKICHVLGGAFDLPHAETHAVILPHAAVLAVRHAAPADARIATALDRGSMGAGEAIAEFADQLGAPRSLQDIGLARADLNEAADRLERALGSLPDPVTRPEIDALLDDAYIGARPRIHAGAIG